MKLVCILLAAQAVSATITFATILYTEHKFRKENITHG